MNGPAFLQFVLSLSSFDDQSFVLNICFRCLVNYKWLFIIFSLCMKFSRYIEHLTGVYTCLVRKYIPTLDERSPASLSGVDVSFCCLSTYEEHSSFICTLFHKLHPCSLSFAKILLKF